MNEAAGRNRVRCLALVALAALAAGSLGAVMRLSGGVSRVAAGAFLILPLLLPLRGLVQGDRRTYAWATLCVLPGFLYGITEMVANPPMRALAASILGLSLVVFFSLVAYLRVTRPAPRRQIAPTP